MVLQSQFTQGEATPSIMIRTSTEDSGIIIEKCGLFGNFLHLCLLLLFLVCLTSTLNSARANNNIFQNVDVLESVQTWEAEDQGLCPGLVTFSCDLQQWLPL